MTEAFERLPGEPPVAWYSFCCYRDLGPTRSLDAVARQLRGQRGWEDGRGTLTKRRLRTRRLQTWSRDWRWRERAEAWDRFVDERVRAALIEEELAMRRRHIEAARRFQARALARLETFTPEELELSPAMVLRWLLAGMALEREAMALAAPPAEPPGDVEYDVVEVPTITRTRQDWPASEEYDGHDEPQLVLCGEP